MRISALLAASLVTLGFVQLAGATPTVTNTGTLTVTGTIESSISLTIEGAGGTTAGLHTAAASTDLGTVSKFGTAPSGFSQAAIPGGWQLSSTVGVAVVQSNSESESYQLLAQLASAPASGITWYLNGAPVSSSSPNLLAEGALYGSTGSYSWDIAIPDAANTATALDNQIVFTAVAN